ncbi:unnamed protein product [Thlaspi arvense]|uniref:GH18 domain-containing protein n=1 Tax=Thlaspi arvense TaxID=13288 RepID=A0AAU9T5I8_THLAR|nr:unnamed protein product [Thlaspi arvense]
MSSISPISLIVSITFFFSLLLCSSSAQTVVKASYWFPESEFPVTDINSTLFTHLFCAFADLNSQTNQVTISSTNQPKFSTFTQTVQRKNPSVKTLLSIGGGIANKTAFASMASNPTSRKSFIDSSIRLARSNGFHGLDLDWEYQSSATEMRNFGTLLSDWRSAVVAEANSTGMPRLLLAAAVFYSNNYYSVLYPVLAVAASLDWINLMAYDFYGPGWSRVTGPPAALYDPSNAGNYNKRTKPNKLAHSYYAATTGAAISPDGSIGYGQIRKFIVDNGATTVYNSTVVGDYCYAGTTWIGYDDNQSIVTKVRYAKQRGLLGYFSWHVGADDNSGLSRAGSSSYHRHKRGILRRWDDRFKMSFKVTTLRTNYKSRRNT